MAEKKDVSGGPAAPAPGVKPVSDASFDRWLTGQMRKLYDEVLEESVPDDLVELVRSFDPDDAGARDHVDDEESAGDRRRPGNSQGRE
jgi:hypothetical protein